MNAERPSQTDDEISAAAAEDVRAMIGRLEPGQLLQMDYVGEGDFVYARIVPGQASEKDKTVERILVNEDYTAGPRQLLDHMVRSGELLETDFCSCWKRP